MAILFLSLFVVILGSLLLIAKGKKIRAYLHARKEKKKIKSITDRTLETVIRQIVVAVTQQTKKQSEEEQNYYNLVQGTRWGRDDALAIRIANSPHIRTWTGELLTSKQRAKTGGVYADTE